jgi:hypothetical protein
MKKIASMCLALCCASIPATSFAALITSLDDIQNWTGSGSNRAGLVIQWNDGGSPTSLAWGYRWNGAASGYDMLTAIAGSWQVVDSADPSIQYLSGSGSDPRFTLDIYDFGWGFATYSISFNEFGVTRTRSDWGSGYWEYFNVGGTFDTPPDGDPNTFLGTDSYPGTVPNSNWISSWSGFDSRMLSDGSWDGWSFAPGFASQAIVQPYDADNYSAAVPEPSQIAATILTLLAMAGFWIKKQAAKKIASRSNA